MPPSDRDDAERGPEGSPVKFLGELGDRHDSVGQPLLVNAAVELHGAGETSPPPPEIGCGIGFGDVTLKPQQITGQLDVAVYDLGVSVSASMTAAQRPTTSSLARAQRDSTW